MLNSADLSGGKAEVKQSASGIEISVAPEQRDPIDTIVELEFNGVVPLQACRQRAGLVRGSVRLVHCHSLGGLKPSPLGDGFSRRGAD